MLIDHFIATDSLGSEGYHARSGALRFGLRDFEMRAWSTPRSRRIFATVARSTPRAKVAVASGGVVFTTIKLLIVE